jgi:hypothetical protein
MNAVFGQAVWRDGEEPGHGYSSLKVVITTVLTLWDTNLLQTILTHSLTPWSRVLLEKLTGLQLVKKFPTFYGTRGFITAFTSARHLYPEPAQSIPYPHILLLEDPSSYYTLIYAWVSPVVSFLQVSPTKPCTRLSSSPSELHAPPISFFSILIMLRYLNTKFSTGNINVIPVIYTNYFYF